MIQILPERVRGVVFQLGRPVDVKGPGVVFLVPFVQTLVRVDLGPQVVELAQLAMASRDGETAQVDATVTFQVLDPMKAITQVSDYRAAVAQAAEVALRSVLERLSANEIRDSATSYASDAAGELNPRIAAWGVKVTSLKAKRSA